MRRLLTVWFLALAATGLAQQAHPPDPAQAGASPGAQVDPQGQCEWISKGKPEMAPLEKACEAAVQGWETLPNFVCDMRVTRREPYRKADKFTAEVRYYEGQEEMQNLTVNGKPSDSIPGGVWARGEFAPPGLSVLDGRSSPAFTFRGEEKSQGGATLLVYDYKIAKSANQAWIWDIPPYHYHPGFHGELKVDKQSGRMRQVSLVADDIDSYVPTLSQSTTTYYLPVQIGELGEYLLPVHAEVKSCGRFSPGCTEISRDFVNCRKFAGKARIIE